MINTMDGKGGGIRRNDPDEEDKILSIHKIGEGSGRRGRNWPFILTMLSFVIGGLLAWSGLFLVWMEELPW